MSDVGPVLIANDVGRAVVEAIRRENASVTVTDRGSYLRVLVPDRCTVSCEGIARVLRRPFSLPSDLEKVLVSFKGRFEVNAERAAWSAGARS
jgi:hypothetical protein